MGSNDHGAEHAVAGRRRSGLGLCRSANTAPGFIAIHGWKIPTKQQTVWKSVGRLRNPESKVPEEQLGASGRQVHHNRTAGIRNNCNHRLCGWTVGVTTVLLAIYYGPRKVLETWDWYLERFTDSKVRGHLREHLFERRPDAFGQLAQFPRVWTPAVRSVAYTRLPGDVATSCTRKGTLFLHSQVNLRARNGQLFGTVQHLARALLAGPEKLTNKHQH